jgi:TolB protein
LCVIDRDGSRFGRLTTDRPLGDARPAWRPDGTSIAFSAYSPEPAIFLFDLTNGAVTRVTDGLHPAWSRDGSRLVFDGVGLPGLYTVNTDGSAVERVTTGAYSEPAWRP